MKAHVVKITKRGVRQAAYLMLADDDEDDDTVLERAIDRISRESGKPLRWLGDVVAELNRTNTADDLVRLVLSKITGRTFGGVDYVGNEIWLDETLGILGMPDKEVTRFSDEALAAVASAAASPWFEDDEQAREKKAPRKRLRRGPGRGRKIRPDRRARSRTDNAQSSAE